MSVIYHHPNSTPEDVFRRLLKRGKFTEGVEVTFYQNPLLPDDTFMLDKSVSLDVSRALGLRPVWSGVLTSLKLVK